MMTELVVWAQSVCRSTMGLYREVKRQAGVPVFVVVRQSSHGDAARQLRERQGQCASKYADVVDAEWDGGFESGLTILAAHSRPGFVHVFSGYQVSASVRRLIGCARSLGHRVIVYDEAPCPMCVGVKAFLKRLYYRWLLPWKVCSSVEFAHRFLSASGELGLDALIRLGWQKEKIVPFGYASDVDDAVACKAERGSREDGPLRILHTGMESPYRGVATLVRAVEILHARGVEVELRRTGGAVPPDELSRLYGWADVLVACGLCEPWGMRVNDAIHAGLPVVVSDGMGAKMLVEEFGCGIVYKHGCAADLAAALERFASDGEFRRAAASGVARAHRAFSPAARAMAFIKAVAPR